MIIKLRKLIKKERSAENLVKLKNLIQNDIIGSIDDNLKLGNITYPDAQRLRHLTHKLYIHIYARYDELEVLNDMTDQSLILDIDDILDESEERIYSIMTECDEKIARAKKEAEAKIASIEEEKEAKITRITKEKDNIIEELKRQIEELKRGTTDET